MSLHINTFISKLPKIIFWIIIAVLAICLIRVMVWEHSYYSEKEGSKRAPVQELGIPAPDQEEVDETEVSAAEITAHIVAPDKPRYFSAEKLSITNARIREVGLTSHGAFATLANIFDVAWYRSSGKPGQGGTMLLNGHNGGPTKNGVFKHLYKLAVGDIISIERGDGEIFSYEVYENKALILAEANDYMPIMQTSPVSGKESISIITCTGDWSQSQRTYLSRSMVRAVLVTDHADS